MSDDLDFIERIVDPEEIGALIDNAIKLVETKNDERAQRAIPRSYNRLWQVVADENAIPDTIEWELWYALAAYESVLSLKNRKKTYAVRLKQKIKREDIFEAVCGAVRKGSSSYGFQKLAEMKRLDASFEEVVVRHPEEFPEDVVAQAKKISR
jgi:hypothetical protein